MMQYPSEVPQSREVNAESVCVMRSGRGENVIALDKVELAEII